ncbi:MAG: OFA family MFS transporter [Desulfobacterales bacterium]|jgi:MFS family permease|nr:OFA family MFS transporter [Desulfobacterales bacterium]
MTTVKNRGWKVTMAGLGVNLALGILYTWSIFKLEIKESITAGDGRFTWDPASLNDPYAVCCLVFAFAMIFAGRLQDKFSPRLTTMIGGVLTGLGLIVISFSNSLIVWIGGFGVLTGLGLGFAYASATPPAIKWFPSSKTGMIAGIVVAGFGLASVYIAPLANFLIAAFGLNRAMMIFGIAFLSVVCFLSLFLVNPPEGYVPEDGGKERKTTAVTSKKPADRLPLQMMKTGTFYKLWLMYFIGAGAGLFIIGGVAAMAKQSLGEAAWLVVALLAIGNAGGRVIAGMLSDKIGRPLTLAIMMTFQALLIFSLIFMNSESAFLVVAAATFIGFNYGTNLSLFPSLTKDHFGMKHFGSNYGIIFSAWGIGGFVFPRAAQMVVAETGTLNAAYIVTAILLLISAAIAVYGFVPVEKGGKLAAPVPRLTKKPAFTELV